MTLPTPITDAAVENVKIFGETQWYGVECISRELERDAMHMALQLYAQDPDTFAIELREVMDRWRPRAEALLGSK